MSGNSFVLDSNIFIYLVGGDKTISSYLENTNIYVSFITEIELYSFQKLTEDEEKTINELLSNCVIMDINEPIKKIAINLRRDYNIKIPDAIISATSLYLDQPLLTSDSHFKNKRIKFIILRKGLVLTICLLSHHLHKLIK